jgi:hypothetical protein
MKPVHHRLSFGVVFLVYSTILGILQKITQITIWTEDNIVFIALIGLPLALMISRKISHGYTNAEENNDILFFFILIILLIIFIGIII